MLCSAIFWSTPALASTPPTLTIKDSYINCHTSVSAVIICDTSTGAVSNANNALVVDTGIRGYVVEFRKWNRRGIGVRNPTIFRDNISGTGSGVQFDDGRGHDKGQLRP
jgi:hypothetical protein